MVNFHKRPAAALKRAKQHAVEALVSMVYCYTPYPSCFQGHRNMLLGAVNSGPARYERVILYHPGIRDRIDKTWELGYSPHYPLMLFRSDYILELLNYHKNILVSRCPT